MLRSGSDVGSLLGVVKSYTRDLKALVAGFFTTHTKLRLSSDALTTLTRQFGEFMEKQGTLIDKMEAVVNSNMTLATSNAKLADAVNNLAGKIDKVGADEHDYLKLTAWLLEKLQVFKNYIGMCKCSANLLHAAIGHGCCEQLIRLHVELSSCSAFPISTRRHDTRGTNGT